MSSASAAIAPARWAPSWPAGCGDARRYLTLAIANYVTLVNPELLILGGGGVVDNVPSRSTRPPAAC